MRAVVLIKDERLARASELALNHGVFATRLARDGSDFDQTVEVWRPQIAIIDIDLPDGLKLLSREGGPGVPTIALTQRNDLKTKLTAFDCGADDVLTLPFMPEELLARARAVVKRSYGVAPKIEPVIKIKGLEVDIIARTVSLHGEELPLTTLELALLYLLAANAGSTLTRDEILDALWGSKYMAESNLVDRHIRNLRQKLRNNWRRPRYILTVPGVGYRFLRNADEDTDSTTA
jgi:two-component system, OmpR family, response regulator PrrA